MNRILLLTLTLALLLLSLFALSACGDDKDEETAFVSIKNDFNNESMEKKPPWVICEAYYGGTFYKGPINLGQTSAEQEVDAGIDYVYMVLAWEDATCAKENCLPVASKNREETVVDQHRVIALNAPNHQGPCPPEGVQPIPEAQYNKILELWPEYSFKSYAERTQNPQCLD